MSKTIQQAVTFRASPERLSVLVLAFATAPGGARLTLVHANVPDRHAGGIRRGWPKYCWKPWRAYLGRA